jgi:hypothetical protein
MGPSPEAFVGTSACRVSAMSKNVRFAHTPTLPRLGFGEAWALTAGGTMLAAYR